MSKRSTQPVVSVVTPVFNGERYVRRTIESVLAQDGVAIEYVVVDGASTDRTMEIVRAYAERISLILSEPDRGMYNAINKGFARTSGSILCYLNSDDTYLPGTLASVARCFAEQAIELCFGDCIHIDSNDREIFRSHGVDLPYRWITRLGRIPFAQQTAFWTRALFDKIGGFDESYRYVADTKFLFECLRHVEARKAHLPDYLACFRLHADALSTRVAAEMQGEHHRVLRELGIRPGFARLLAEAAVKWRNRKNIAQRLLRGRWSGRSHAG
jgi:glycosyltransferase involved in cell wall biosynthesis